MPRPRHRHPVAVGDGLAVPVDLDVGDAVVVDQPAQHVPEPVHAVAATLPHQIGELPPGRPHLAGCVDELVEAGGAERTGDRDAAAHVEQRFLGAGGAIALQQSVRIVAAEVGTGDRQRHLPTSCPGHQLCSTVRTLRRSRMPGAPTSVDSRAPFSRTSARSMRPGVNPCASNRLPRRDSASTALTGGTS